MKIQFFSLVAACGSWLAYALPGTGSPLDSWWAQSIQNSALLEKLGKAMVAGHLPGLHNQPCDFPQKESPMWLVLAGAYWKVTRRGEGQYGEAKAGLSYTTVRPSQNVLTRYTIAFFVLWSGARTQGFIK